MNRHLLSSAALFVVFASPALAQESEPTEADTVFGDIVVTAQKRSERVQDVPKQVQVVSTADLQSAGVSQLRELGNISPSISGSSNSNGTPAIRGVSSFAFSIGVQAQTGIVIDDIPQPTFSTLANELADIERVEVLAGPQSTLSGRNAAGGLINIVTRSPKNEWGLDATYEQTTDGQYRATGFVTGPLSEGLAFSLSAYRNKWDGAIENIRDGGGVLGYDVWGLRGKLRAEITPAITATLSGFYQRSDTNRMPSGGGVYITSGTGSLFGQTFAQRFPGVTASLDNQEVFALNIGQVKARSRGGDLRIDFDLGPATLSSITSYSKYDRPTVDFFAPFPNAIVHQDILVDYFTQELRLASNGRGPLQYVVGAIYYDTDTSFEYHRVGFGPIDRFLGTGIKNMALFGRATYEVTPRLFVTGGLRYAHDKYTYASIFRPIAGGQAVLNTASGGRNYDFLAGEASVRYQVTDDTNLYVTVSRGETGRAFDLEDAASLLAGGLPLLESEKVWNVEAGIKAQSPDRRRTANLNAYWARYTNYQVQSLQVIDQNTPPVIRLFSIGEVETKGVEFTGNFRPNQNLTLTLNAAYLDAKILDYPNADCYRFQTPATGCVAASNRQLNIAGLSMPNSPKVKASGGVSGVLPLSASSPVDLTGNLFVRYQSSSRFDLFGDPALKFGGYAVVNLMLGVQSKDERIKFDVFVNNLFDKRNYQSVLNEVFWTTPHLSATYNRDSFRYGGARIRVGF
jgi:iron complex outermembrane recepter protein